jgi:hypothetical protein
MLNALLLPLLLAGAPVGQNEDPAVQLWISSDRRFVPGDRARVHVRAREDGYLVVLHSDADGHLRVLFPLDPSDDNFVRGGKRYEIHDRGGREAFEADRTGRGMVYAAISRAPFRFDGYVLGDHWDYRTLAPERLPRDPETELTDLARRLAGGSFDYDVLSYDVLERVVYASDYSYSRPYYGSYYGSYYDDPWCGSYWNRCGGGLSIGINFGRPYRYGYYHPYGYGYDPYYDPFFYDPYYYRPAYYYPVPRYYYYPYRGYYYPYRSSYYPRYRDYWRYDHRYTGYANPSTPYRFRGSLASNDLRDRNYGFRRAVNTVYTPPVTRAGEPERASPLRREVDRAGAGADRPIEARREATRRDPGTAERREPASRRSTEARPEPSVERGRIEARRAREREPEQAGTMRDAREYRGPNRPEEVQGRRAAGDDRPNIERAPARVERPDLPEARPVRRAEDRPSESRAEPRSEPRPEPRAEPRYEPRSAPRDNGGGGGGGGRVERSGPPPSSSGYDGGRRSAGGGGGNDGGGGRRR